MKKAAAKTKKQVVDVEPVEVTTEQPQPNQVTWGPVAAVLCIVGIYFFSQLGAGALLSLYATARHWSTQQLTDFLEGGVAGQFATVATIEAFSLLFIYIFLKQFKTRIQAIGFKRPRLSDIAYSFAGFGAYFPLYIIGLQIVKALTPVNINQQQEIGFNTSVGGTSLVLVFISLVILPPIVEEIMFRGVLYTGLRTKLKFASALVLTGVIFALPHLQFGSGQPLLWVAAVDTFILSAVLVYLREKTGSLWPSIGLHMIKNSIAFLALFIFHIG